MLQDVIIQVKKNYRTKPQPSTDERENLKARAYKFTTQTKLSGVFKTSAQNVYEAFRGNNPKLMNKLKAYIENYEARKAS